MPRSANTFGQLGLGTAEGAWGDNPNEMGDALPFVVGGGAWGIAAYACDESHGTSRTHVLRGAGCRVP